MSENYIVINGKRAELTKEQMEQLGIEIKKNRRWRANYNDWYWSVTLSNKLQAELEGLSPSFDNFRYYSHNYFQTQEEAEAYARVLETEMLLKKYADENNTEFKDFKDVKYYLIWSSIADDFSIDFVEYYACRPRTIFFSSREIVQDAIKEIGLERILEYLKYEW